MQLLRGIPTFHFGYGVIAIIIAGIFSTLLSTGVDMGAYELGGLVN